MTNKYHSALSLSIALFLQLLLAAATYADPIGISFYRGQDPTAQLHLVDLNGGNFIQLSNGTLPETVHSWSPDGKRLLFTRLAAPPFNSSEIYIADVDTFGVLSNIINVTEDPSNDHSAAWFSDGQSIVFSSNRHGNYELYSMDVSDLSNIPAIPVQRLTNTAENELNPDVASDGSIVAALNEDDLTILTAVGSSYSRSVISIAGFSFTPTWSPDSQTIAFANGSLPGGSVNNDLIIRLIDRLGNTVHTIPGFGNGPDWSSNANDIVYVDSKNGLPGQLNIYDRDSGTSSLLGQVGNLPQWRPNPVTDSDDDGIPDPMDSCPNSILTLTVIVNGEDSGVGNHLQDSGCTVSDLLYQACSGDFRNHGAFVSCVAHATKSLRRAGIITNKEKARIQRAAARSR